jgi:hypothetical protein
MINGGGGIVADLNGGRSFHPAHDFIQKTEAAGCSPDVAIFSNVWATLVFASTAAESSRVDCGGLRRITLIPSRSRER